MQTIENFKSGFVGIIGKPNVGKSTLLNRLTGEKLAIVTPKAQTTRHRILGIITTDTYQLVFSDTPGVIKPKYELHKKMMDFVAGSIEDADVILLMCEATDTEIEEEILTKLRNIESPIILVVNKIDLIKDLNILGNVTAMWQKAIPRIQQVIHVSAEKAANTDKIIPAMVELMPVHPPYYPLDELTDKSERFLASEIIREQIFKNFSEEIPYSCEVIVTSFKESENIIKISAEIFVERDTQKGIIIGEKGSGLKKIGTAARLEMEKFFRKPIFLEQHVKVVPDWRSKKDHLKRLGYYLD